MDQNFAHFEALCETLYGPDPNQAANFQQRRQPSHDERQRADQELKNFTEDVSNLGALKLYLEKSTSKFVQFVAASALKQLFTQNWCKIPTAEKLSIKDFIIDFMVRKESSLDQQVIKMVIILLAKITKMSWFDHPEIQGVVQNLFNLQTMNNERLTLLSWTALHDLIIEMSYVHKVRNLNVNRRISLSFRDGQLFAVFKQSLQHVELLINQI